MKEITLMILFGLFSIQMFGQVSTLPERDFARIPSGISIDPPTNGGNDVCPPTSTINGDSRNEARQTFDSQPYPGPSPRNFRPMPFRQFRFPNPHHAYSPVNPSAQFEIMRSRARLHSTRNVARFFNRN